MALITFHSFPSRWHKSLSIHFLQDGTNHFPLVYFKMALITYHSFSSRWHKSLSIHFLQDVTNHFPFIFFMMTLLICFHSFNNGIKHLLLSFKNLLILPFIPLTLLLFTYEPYLFMLATSAQFFITIFSILHLSVWNRQCCLCFTITFLVVMR